jgi:hypothetical protein
LGVQAIKNADRFLGQIGDGGHPRRPTDDQLEKAEDIEDALEAIIRFLRKPHRPTRAKRHKSAPTAGDNFPPLRSWTQDELNAAISKYIAQRADALKSLKEKVQAGSKGVAESATAVFGRNHIASALGVKARAMVSKSPAWIEIADQLGLRPDPSRKRRRKIGFDIALEQKSIELSNDAAASTAIEDTSSGEATETAKAIMLVRKHLPRKEADGLVEKIHRGETSPNDAIEIVEMFRHDSDDG